MPERLQKVLAAAGVASRRDAETLITSGKVTVNGKRVTELGFRVDPERDHVAVEGKGIPRNVRHLYVVLYKPAGYVTTREDRHATHTVMDLIRPPLEEKLGAGDPAIEGLHPVGRLDAQSEGLLILTNDGAFTNALTHPRHGVPKLYRAEVRGIPTEEEIERLRTGVPLFGVRTAPARVRVIRRDRSREIASVEVELREGRNQQVRRMLQAVGHPVTKLRRVAVGPVTLSRMKPGQWRFLTDNEVEQLQRMGSQPQDGETPQATARRRPRPPAARSKAATGRPRARPEEPAQPASPKKGRRASGGRPSTPRPPAPRTPSKGDGGRRSQRDRS